MKSFIVATIEGNTNVYDYEGFNRATFNPFLDYEYVVLGKLTGRTYKERKAEVEQKAIDFQRIDEGGLSYGELALIQSYFETYGKRYGLMREFKENCIC